MRRPDCRPPCRPHRAALPLLLLSFALPLAGCGFFSPDQRVRGNRVDLDALKDLTPGTSTEADVTSALGSPTAHASFDDSTWIYIGQVTEPQIAGTNDVLKQRVIALNFDGKGVLRSIKKLNKKDAKPVAMVSRVTPSPGSESTFLQQLFGSVGGVGLAQQPSGPPGATVGGQQ